MYNLEVYAKPCVGRPYFIYANQISIFLNCNALYTCSVFFSSLCVRTTFKAVCDIWMNCVHVPESDESRETIEIFEYTFSSKMVARRTVAKCFILSSFGLGWCGKGRVGGWGGVINITARSDIRILKNWLLSSSFIHRATRHHVFSSADAHVHYVHIVNL